ncbi:HET domain protein [Naviculisporaceae sp. PSN 640]
MSQPPGLRSLRVVVTGTSGEEEEGTQHERRTFENVLVDSGGYIYLYSPRPPQDTFKFGIPIGQDEWFRQVHRVRLTYPSERSITKDREQDGLCTYCQLLLLDDAPEYAAHQPCMGLLIRNWDRCQLCTLINVSIGQANPEWKAKYNSGDMDIASPDTRIWVQSKKFERHSLILATMGVEPNPTIRGTPIVWITSKSLGSLKNRLIWKSIYNSEPGDASARLDVIKEWLEECQSTHISCNRPTSSRLPTRVLKLSPRLDDDTGIPFIIQLYEPSGKEESAPYIALSHCWGDMKSGGPLRTTRSNIHQHKEEIPFEALPLSFRDIVAKTWYLGFTYLWIDSLCIIQDDSDDWEAEAARMAAVYSNATLTFAATEAADPSLGCCPQYTRAFPIPLPTSEDKDQVALIRFQDHLNLNSENAALNKRGWTFQEAALSRRMVCFDTDQLLWKCCSRQESEDGLMVATEPGVGGVGGWNVWACLRTLGNEVASRYDFWYRMMEDYSKRQFTFEKDRLPALAGIVDVFQRDNDDEPLLGLWREDLLNGLLWRPCKPAASNERGSRESGASSLPSWSWVSAAGPVTWRPLRSISSEDERLELISADVRWAGCPMTSPVLGTTLKVNGRLKKAELFKQPGTDFVYLYECEASCAVEEDGRQKGKTAAVEQPVRALLGYCQLDLVETESCLPDHVWCLEVYQGLQWRDTRAPRNHVHKVLILEPVTVNENSHGSEPEFGRVGIGIMWQHAYRKDETRGEEIAVEETFSNVARRTLSIL